jgi:hypothetical protein
MTCSRWVTICADIADHPVVGVKSGAWMGWWIYLIANANWRDRAVAHKGRSVGSTLKLSRGQMLAGRAYLAKEWGCTEKQVRSFLKKLVDEGMIEKVQSKGHFANVITICNYDAYQSNKQPEGQCEGQLGASSGPVEGQTLTRDTIVTSSEEKSFAPQPSAAAAKPKKASRGARLADDWQLPGEWHEWAVKEFDAAPAAVSAQAEKFRDYWIAQPGQKGVKANWFSTWKNWCRTARERSASRYGKPPATAFTGTKKEIADWNARQQAALERQLKDLEFQP